MTRLASVSSTRSTNAPPLCRANSQLNSADRAFPTWIEPDGAGANRQRTASGTYATTGFESVPTPSTSTSTTSPRREPSDAFGRPGQQDVAGQERHELGDVLDQLGHAEHHVGRLRRLHGSRRSGASPRRMSLGSSSVSTHGPSGHEPSNPFARAHWSSIFWRSRSVTSFAHV